MTDIQQTLAAYIADTVLRQPGRDIPADTALLSSGLVDSFQLVDLAMYIEDTFGVKIEDTELSTQTFDTLGQLAVLVEARKGQ